MNIIYSYSLIYTKNIINIVVDKFLICVSMYIDYIIHTTDNGFVSKF